MRALVNDGATASREESPCTTTEELAKAVAASPRIRPPEHAPPVYRPAAFQQPPPPPGGASRASMNAVPMPPPALPGRTGQALKWAVSILLIVAIGLGSWQLADTLKSSENSSTSPTPTGQKAGQDPTTAPVPQPLAIQSVKDFDPLGDGGDGSETPSEVNNVSDGKADTFWETKGYARADLGGLKPGVGIIVDLGSAHTISSVKVDLVGDTSVDLMAAPDGTSTMPTELDGFTKVASGQGTTVTLKPTSKVTSRFVLVWLTNLPLTDEGTYPYRGKISEITVMG
jgi:hypothetical protein